MKIFKKLGKSLKSFCQQNKSIVSKTISPKENKIIKNNEK